MAKSRAQRKAAKRARKAAKRAARAAGAPKPSKGALRKITRSAVKSVSRGGGGGGRSGGRSGGGGGGGRTNKQKTQKYISKILSDGKVSKREVRKAIKKGISPERISGAAKKYSTPGNPFSKSSSGISKYFGRGSGATPKGIRITPGAEKAIARGVAARGAGTPNVPTAPPAAGPGPGPGPGFDSDVNPYQAEFDAYEQALAEYQAELDALSGLEDEYAAEAEAMAAEYQAAIEEMQAQQALAMEEMNARFEEQERQRQLTSQTQQANTARAGLMPDFSIGGRTRADLYGTGGFKRRRRFGPATIAQGIAPTAPTARATNGNLLNI